MGLDVVDLGNLRDRRDGRDMIGRDQLQTGPILFSDPYRPPSVSPSYALSNASRCAGAVTVFSTSSWFYREAGGGFGGKCR